LAGTDPTPSWHSRKYWKRHPERKPIEQNQAEQSVERYSPNRLAIVLACLAGTMAIILFLAEKTPTVVVSSLALMMLLVIYPVLDFFKRAYSRIIVLACVVLAIATFGYTFWPKSKSPHEQGSAGKLLFRFETRPMFHYMEKCGCTLVAIVGTVTNLGYSPQTTVHDWGLRILTTQGHPVVGSPIPVPSGARIHMHDNDPSRPPQLFMGDESLVERSGVPIALGDQRSGTLFFSLHAVKALEMADPKNMITVSYKSADDSPYSAVFNDGDLTNAKIPGIKSGIDWEELVKQYNESQPRNGK